WDSSDGDEHPRKRSANSPSPYAVPPRMRPNEVRTKDAGLLLSSSIPLYFVGHVSQVARLVGKEQRMRANLWYRRGTALLPRSLQDTFYLCSGGDRAGLGAYGGAIVRVCSEERQ